MQTIIPHQEVPTFLTTLPTLCRLAAGESGSRRLMPTVRDPQNLKGAFSNRAEIEDADKAGTKLVFAETRSSTKTPSRQAAAGRRAYCPPQPLIRVPLYETCGKYGGTLRGHSAGARIRHPAY